MNSYNIADLKAGTSYDSDLMLDSLFVITTPPCGLLQSQIDSLKEWGFTELYSESTVTTATPDPAEFNITPEKKQQAKVSLANSEEVFIDDTGDFKTKTIDSKLISIKDEIRKMSEQQSDDEKMQLEFVQNCYNQYMIYINHIFTRFATHKTLDYDELYSTMKSACKYVKKYHKYMLRVVPSIENRTKNFLVCHSIRCTVLSIVIAQQLKLPEQEIIELGVASLIHEIGQIRLPPQLYLSDRKLTPTEKAQLNTHPIIGFNIVKNLQFPESIQQAVLFHHERQNGTGYPKKLTAEKIPLYARILAIACSFEAITAPRKFKTERSNYDAMIEMLQNPNGIYDSVILKALLLSLSLIPIGSYVYLTNGKIAQVIDVNPQNPKNPIVQIIDEKGPLGEPLNVQTDDNMFKISRVLSPQESKDIVKALKEKQES